MGRSPGAGGRVVEKLLQESHRDVAMSVSTTHGPARRRGGAVTARPAGDTGEISAV